MEEPTELIIVNSEIQEYVLKWYEVHISKRVFLWDAVNICRTMWTNVFAYLSGRSERNLFLDKSRSSEKRAVVSFESIYLLIFLTWNSKTNKRNNSHRLFVLLKNSGKKTRTLSGS